MKKFWVLLQKEVRELLTLQMVLPFILILLVFSFIGRVVGAEQEKQTAASAVAIIDLDQTEISQSIKPILEQTDITVHEISAETDEVDSVVAQAEQRVVMVIPEGFGTAVADSTGATIDVYSRIDSIAIMGNRDVQNVQVIAVALDEAMSSIILQSKLPDINVAVVKHPVSLQNYVTVEGKQAQIDPLSVISYLGTQTVIIPIVLFLVITIAAQLVATGIATEKENKTLETLLSMPVDRRAVVAAKLVAAGLVSLVIAVIYLVGMRNYMSGMAGGSLSMEVTDGTQHAIEQLGLTFSTSDYLLLGASLFAGILAALAIAFILGSFASDSKSAQGVISPLMVMLLIPYLLTLSVDIHSLSLPVRALVYAIPFAHTFMAAPNILLGQYDAVLWGIGYVLAFFAVCIVIASTLFSTEKILTLNINLKKQRPQV